MYTKLVRFYASIKIPGVFETFFKEMSASGSPFVLTAYSQFVLKCISYVKTVPVTV